IGLALGIGLAAASLSGLASAWAAARWGRRPVLAAAGILMALTGLDLALASQPLLLVLAGLTGMLGAASVDLGPFASVEQAGLAARSALDALGGVFVVNAVIAYWLHARFGVGASLLGPVFAAVAVLQSLSYEVSARLANRIGLINTMVFTHLPSNILLLLVPFSPTLSWAIALLLARFVLSQMDVPARQAYVVSIVPPAERAGAVATTGAVRGVAQSFGPAVAGAASGAAAFGIPFF